MSTAGKRWFLATMALTALVLATLTGVSAGASTATCATAGSGAQLFGVAATSTTYAWAVGNRRGAHPDRAVERRRLVPGAESEPERHLRAERTELGVRYVGHGRLGGGVFQQRDRRRKDAHPALGRHIMAAGCQP